MYKYTYIHIYVYIYIYTHILEDKPPSELATCRMFMPTLKSRICCTQQYHFGCNIFRMFIFRMFITNTEINNMLRALVFLDNSHPPARRVGGQESLNSMIAECYRNYVTILLYTDMLSYIVSILYCLLV